jgi:hypothetical protein
MSFRAEAGRRLPGLMTTLHLLRLGDVEIYRPTEDFWDILVLFMIMRDNNPLEYIIPLYSDGLGTFFFYLEMEGSGGEAR